METAAEILVQAGKSEQSPLTLSLLKQLMAVIQWDAFTVITKGVIHHTSPCMWERHAVHVPHVHSEGKYSQL